MRLQIQNHSLNFVLKKLSNVRYAPGFNERALDFHSESYLSAHKCMETSAHMNFKPPDKIRTSRQIQNFHNKFFCSRSNRRKFSSETKGDTSERIYLQNTNDDDELRILLENHNQLMMQFSKTAPGTDSHLASVKRQVDILRDIGMYFWNTSNIEASKEATEDAITHLLVLQSSSEKPDIEKELSTLLHFMGNIYARMAIGKDSTTALSQNKIMYLKTEALKWFSKSLELKREHFGHDHAEVGKTLNGMGMLYAPSSRMVEKKRDGNKTSNTSEHFEENVEKAKSLFQESVSIFRQEYSDDHPFVASVRENLGRVYMVGGIYKDALEEFSEVLRIKQQYIDIGGLDPNDEAIANLHSVIGDCLLDLNKNIEEALASYITAVKILEMKEEYKKSNTLLATTYHKLGVTYSRMSKLDMALAQFEASLEMKKNIGGDDHFEVGVTLNSMGAVYGSKGDKGKALSFFREALRIFKKHAVTAEGVLDTEDINVLNAQSNIAMVQSSQMN